MSKINKITAAKKQWHHRTGSGGYLKARPLWDKAEQDLIAKGVEPETLNWPDHSWTCFFGVGGTLDPEAGKCHWTDKQLATPITKLQAAIKAVQEGTFIPDRENDELTEALGNPEHPGRTRCTPGSVPWVVGFPGHGDERNAEAQCKNGKARGTCSCRPTISAARISYPRSYPTISAEKQRGFHGARSA